MNVLIDPAAHPVIAHRGNSAHAPENTFESFDQAIALGVDALEFDVRLTREGVPVVIHDATVDRTTNHSGPVASFTLNELQQLDAGARFTADRGLTYPYRGQGARIPTLRQLIERYATIPLLIEVKAPDAVEPTREVLAKNGALARVLVDSTVHAAVAPFRGGTMATGASLNDVLQFFRRIWRVPRTLPYQAFCIPRWYYGVRVPVLRLARAARAAGVVTHVWTVNLPSIARCLWLAGVQGIITDDPGPMLRLRTGLFGA